MAVGGKQPTLEGQISLGEPFDCSTTLPGDIDDVASLGDGAKLDASQIRRILVGGKIGLPPESSNGHAQSGAMPPHHRWGRRAESEPAVTVDPRGIWIRGARISGELNLKGLPSDTKIGLRLTLCLLEQPLTLSDGGLPWLELNTCVLPAIVADRAQLGMMAVQGCRLISDCPRERVSLNRAHVTGDLLLDHTCVHAAPWRPTEKAPNTMDLSGAKIDGQLSMEGITVRSDPGPQPADWRGSESAAAVCLSGATIAGSLVLRGAQLTSTSGAALLADHITVSGDALLDGSGGTPVSATGAGKDGAVYLVGASVTGRLSLSGARLTNETGPALFADLLSVKGPTLLDVGFEADGAVRLWGATLTGDLSMVGATVETKAPANEHEPGLAAAVWLSGATLSSRLLLRGATLRSREGPALMANYLTVNSDAFACEKGNSQFRATGAGELGTVCLAAANIKGQLALRGSQLANTAPAKGNRAPALLIDEANIEGDVLIDEGFTATTQAESTAVSLINATIGKRLDCTLQRSEERPPLDFRELTVGTFTLNIDALSDERQPRNAKLLRLDGLKYTEMPTLTRASVGGLDCSSPATRRTWISLLGRAEYAPQPYQALAGAYGALGDDTSARDVLIAQRNAGLARLRRGSPAWVYQWMLRLVIGYGYRSIKALYWLVGLFLVTLLLAATWFTSSHFIGLSPNAATAAPTAQSGQRAGASTSTAATVTTTTAKTATATKTVSTTTTAPAQLVPCTFPGNWNYAISLSFPIIGLSGTDDPQCGIPSQDPNEFVVFYSWFVRIAAVTLAGFYAAGLAGLTKTPPSS